MKAPRSRFMYEVLTLVSLLQISTISTSLGYPEFSQAIPNVTVSVGRDAVLSCIVKDLEPYKVAWLREDTQTILTIQNHLLTRNYRISVSSSSDSGGRAWYLHIRNVQQSDEGRYMCQINTDPMQMQVGFLTVVVPPDILDYHSSKDMYLHEGDNVTLECEARGSPQPTIVWKRENGYHIRLQNDQLVSVVEGSSLSISRVSRQDMGSYLCIASNGVRPSVSKRIMVIVNFPPVVSVENQLLSAYVGGDVTLTCYVEAHPRPITYWTNERGEIILQSQKYITEIIRDDNTNVYKGRTELTIKSVNKSDFGVYQCVSKNSVGGTELSVKLYEIVNATTFSDEGAKITVYHSNLWQRENLRSGGTTRYRHMHHHLSTATFALLCLFTIVHIL